MRIGIIHYKVGDTDGVSLEIDKWKLVLEKMGHDVFLCGGDLGTVEGTLIEELYHHSDIAERLYNQTFVELQEDSEDEYRQDLLKQAAEIACRLQDFVVDHRLELLIVENIWSVAANPAVAIATAGVLREVGIPGLAHNHDFYWERIEGVRLTSSTAVELADKYLPPHDPAIRHAVINSLAQQELLERKGIRSSVVPNVFDFDSPPWDIDEYNHDFRRRIGLNNDDVVILQATRVVTRKAIELAVDFVKAMSTESRRAVLKDRGLYDGRSFDEDSRIVLVLAGYTQDDTSREYVKKLKKKIADEGIDALFIADLVDSHRTAGDGVKKYSLWDTYVLADFVTYPSLWEGWGNQLLEAVRAQKPFLLFEYAVYTADIAASGFKAVSLGAEIHGRDYQGLATVRPGQIQTAADEAVELLTNRQKRNDFVEHNYTVARRVYSLQALEKYLSPLLAAVVTR